MPTPTASNQLTINQEQALVERQEGSKEENPGSLHPQGLVLSQGSLLIQPARVRQKSADYKSPRINTCSVGKTLVNRTTGLKNANDALKGRIIEVSLDIRVSGEGTYPCCHSPDRGRSPVPDHSRKNGVIRGQYDSPRKPCPRPG